MRSDERRAETPGTDAGTSPSPGIVLIGPVAAGKSTLAGLLARHLDVPHISLDDLADPYYEESGLPRSAIEQLGQERGFLAAYRQWWPSLAYATEQVLARHPHGVIDLGAGHTHYEDDRLFERVRRALAPYRAVILILPSPDLDRSVRILRERSVRERGWDWTADGYDFIEHWVKDRCNRELATLTVYTEGSPPEETRDEILERAGLRRRQALALSAPFRE